MLVWFAAAVGVVLSMAALKRFKSKGQREAEAALAKEQKEALRKAVAAGSHDDSGRPLCRVCGDRGDPATVASEYGYRVERETGLAQWVREQLGAPGRYRIGRAVDDELRFCREHAAMAESETGLYLISFETQRREQLRDAATELAHFERVGLDVRLKARVAEHERAMKRADLDRPPVSAKVVNLR